MELTNQRTTALNKIAFLPQMSLSFAHTGAAAALANKYEPPIQEYPDAELSCEQMVGIAVAIMVEFKADINSVNYKDLSALFQLDFNFLTGFLKGQTNIEGEHHGG